jgi:hypothetical protein
MILMGDLPFRVAFGNFTQPSRKCQLFLLSDDTRVLCSEVRGKSPARQSKRYNLAAL